MEIIVTQDFFLSIDMIHKNTLGYNPMSSEKSQCTPFEQQSSIYDEEWSMKNGVVQNRLEPIYNCSSFL